MSQYLLFDLNLTRYALPASAVEGAYPMPLLTPAQDLPPYFTGLMTLRGNIVPVVDLERRFGRVAHPLHPDQRLIVLRKDEGCVGLLADHIVDLADLPNEDIEPYFQVEGACTAFSPAVIRGCAHGRDGAVIVLDAEALLQRVFDVSVEQMPDGDAQVETNNLEAEVIEIMRARAQDLATPLVVPEMRPDWYAVVRINDSQFAIKLAQVSEFAHLGHYTPVPCCPSHILGCMNLRGSIITVLDVAPILTDTQCRDPRKVAVIHLGGQRVALAVSEVIDVAAFAASDATQWTGHASDQARARRLLRSGDDIAEVIDLDALLREGLLEVKEQV